jgi:sarcosine oxidase subunit gamma
MPHDGAHCELRAAPAARRIGIKGRGATTLFARHGIAPPQRPNSWIAAMLPGARPARLLRLGASEYLLDCDARTPGPDPLAFLADPPPACYPVLRDDVAFLLGGRGCESLLAEVCNVDFAALEQAGSTVVLTLMAGVAVTVVCETGAEPLYRIWCDPSFGHYLWTSLRDVVSEGGGRVVQRIAESNEVFT